MAEPISPSQTLERVPPTTGEDASPALMAFVEGLVSPAKISELILLLEAHRDGATLEGEHARLIQALSREGGVDLADPHAIDRAVVVLGDRAQALGKGLPALGERSAESVALTLLKVADSTRHRVPPGEGFEATLHGRISDALAAYRLARDEGSLHEARWWAEIEDSAQRRLVPAFARVAPTLSRLESAPIRGALLRSPWLTAAVCALPGLLTIPLPVSTPLTLGVLALFGGLVVHPTWLGRLQARISAIGESLAGEGPRIARLSGERAVGEEDFALAGILEDLSPILEGERLAGRIEPGAVTPGIEDYFADIAPIFASVSSRGPRYLENLKDFALGRLLGEHATWARARSAIEGSWLGALLDVPRRSALAMAIIGLPLAFMASRISPLPQAVDVPLMVLLLGALGHTLSRSLPGTLPSREAMMTRLLQYQEDLDVLP